MNTSTVENLDTEYYLAHAQELRRQYIAKASKRLVARIKTLCLTRARLVLAKGQPAH